MGANFREIFVTIFVSILFLFYFDTFVRYSLTGNPLLARPNTQSQSPELYLDLVKHQKRRTAFYMLGDSKKKPKNIILMENLLRFSKKKKIYFIHF